jgi:hypothetical protein
MNIIFVLISFYYLYHLQFKLDLIQELLEMQLINKFRKQIQNIPNCTMEYHMLYMESIISFTDRRRKKLIYLSSVKNNWETNYVSSAKKKHSANPLIC